MADEPNKGGRPKNATERDLDALREALEARIAALEAVQAEAVVTTTSGLVTRQGGALDDFQPVNRALFYAILVGAHALQGGSALKAIPNMATDQAWQTIYDAYCSLARGEKAAPLGKELEKARRDLDELKERLNTALMNLTNKTKECDQLEQKIRALGIVVE